MTSDRLLELQLTLQHKMDYDFQTMTDEERIDFIRWNVLACTDELHEALGEVGWKPWATGRHINQVACLKELIDAYHFLNNLWLCVTRLAPIPAAELLEQMYENKHSVNVDRQVDGYDGVTGKCPSCHRALDDLSDSYVRITEDGNRVLVCACGATVLLSEQEDEEE